MAASVHVWPNSSRDDSLSLHIHTNVPVDQRRLFHAFTLAEYLELWLVPPSAKVRCKSASGAGSPMEFFLHGTPRDQCCSIKAIYYFLNEPSRIVLGWKKEDDLSSLETLVSIDLSTRGETTLLTLVQSGFDSTRSRTWHELFWRAKLGRLQSILSTHDSSRPQARSDQTVSRISRVV